MKDIPIFLAVKMYDEHGIVHIVNDGVISVRGTEEYAEYVQGILDPRD